MVVVVAAKTPLPVTGVIWCLKLHMTGWTPGPGERCRQGSVLGPGAWTTVKDFVSSSDQESLQSFQISRNCPIPGTGILEASGV